MSSTCRLGPTMNSTRAFRDPAIGLATHSTSLPATTLFLSLTVSLSLCLLLYLSLSPVLMQIIYTPVSEPCLVVNSWLNNPLVFGLVFSSLVSGQPHNGPSYASPAPHRVVRLISLRLKPNTADKVLALAAWLLQATINSFAVYLIQNMLGLLTRLRIVAGHLPLIADINGVFEMRAWHEKESSEATVLKSWLYLQASSSWQFLMSYEWRYSSLNLQTLLIFRIVNTVETVMCLSRLSINAFTTS